MAYRTIGRQRTIGELAPPAAPGPFDGMRFDAPTLTIYVGASKIPLVPALISALAVKLILFGGRKAGTAAKAAITRRFAKKPA